MKNFVRVIFGGGAFARLMLLSAPLGLAQARPEPREPVPVYQAPPNNDDKSLLTPPGGENQRVYGPRYTSLVEAEVARELNKKFRAAYASEAAPRIVIYVNRALIEDAGLRLTRRTEKTFEGVTSAKGDVPASTTTDISGENTYEADDDVTEPTLADRQTVRDVERLFGRVFRNAGAKLADQDAAGIVADEQPGVQLGARQAVKERAALRAVADVAIEVLIASRDLTVRGISGDATYAVPDIQATAIRLSDAAILGQAAASDVLGGDAGAGDVARQFGVRDITEATAFALIEDMLTGR